jgi:hypothetical protein
MPCQYLIMSIFHKTNEYEVRFLMLDEKKH